MKTTLFSFLLFFCAVYAAAQTNYYTETKTFQESGYTYRCDVLSGNDTRFYDIGRTGKLLYDYFLDTQNRI